MTEKIGGDGFTKTQRAELFRERGSITEEGYQRMITEAAAESAGPEMTDDERLIADSKAIHRENYLQALSDPNANESRIRAEYQGLMDGVVGKPGEDMAEALSLRPQSTPTDFLSNYTDEEIGDNLLELHKNFTKNKSKIETLTKILEKRNN